MLKPFAPFAVALAALFASPADAGTCGTPGTGGLVPKLSISKELWDADTTFTIEDALPGAGWAWLLDVGAGPLPSSYGTLCVGPTFLVLFDFLGGQVPIGPNGRLDLTFPVPVSSAAALGTTFHNQVLVVDAGAQGGAALSTSATLTLRAPRVLVASDAGQVDVIDGQKATVAFPTPIEQTANGSVADCAISRDGERMYVRRNGGSVNHGVLAYDISGATPVFLGEALAPTPALFGKPRNGVIVSNDDRFGYFTDDGWLHEFDADPSSATFMNVTRSTVSSVAGIDLAISNDDSVVFVTDGTNKCIPYDTATFTEQPTIVLSSVQGLLGFVLRYSCEVSPNGKWLATIQQGVLVGSPQLDGYAMLNVVSIDPNSPAFLQEVAAVPLPNWGQMQLAFDPKDPNDGTIVTLASDSSGAYELQVVDWATATVSQVPVGVGNGLGNEDGGLGFSPNGSFLYVACRGDDSFHVFDAGLNKLGSTSMGAAGESWFVQVER